MQEFMINIDNKEILIEILNHSIEYLIGDVKDGTLLKLCHKYGFHCPDAFLSTIKSIAKIFKAHCLEGTSKSVLLADFANMNLDLQRMVPPVFNARRQDIMKFLIREQNTRHQAVLLSFDWDVRLMLGDCSLAENKRELATVTFNCLESCGKFQNLHFQMSQEKLNEFIEALEKASTIKVIANS